MASCEAGQGGAKTEKFGEPQLIAPQSKACARDYDKQSVLLLSLRHELR